MPHLATLKDLQKNIYTPCQAVIGPPKTSILSFAQFIYDPFSKIVTNPFFFFKVRR